jgi:glutathione S-transferase
MGSNPDPCQDHPMPDTPRLVLYADDHWISPYVFSSFVALKEKGVPFETRAIALHRGEQKKPEYRDRTLTARVPALEHGDFVVAESSAIVEYVEELFPAPKHPRLLPADAQDRARARQIMSWIRSDLMPIREERPTTTMFYQRATEPLSEKGVEAAEKLLGVADRLIRDGQTALFGGAYSIADSDLAFMLQRLLLNGHDTKPKIRAFVDAQWARASVREFVDRKRPLYAEY